MDISLYTDGEQATAAVLNRPLNQIKGAVDSLETVSEYVETLNNNSLMIEEGKARIKEYNFYTSTYSWNHDDNTETSNVYGKRPLRICKMKPSYGRCEIELTMASDSNYASQVSVYRFSLSAYNNTSNSIYGRRIMGTADLTMFIDSLGYLWVWAIGIWDSRCSIKLWRDIHIVDWEFSHKDEIIYHKTGGDTKWYMKDQNGTEIEMVGKDEYELGFPRGILCDSTRRWGMVFLDEEDNIIKPAYEMRGKVTSTEDIYLRFYQSALDNEDGTKSDYTYYMDYMDKGE